MSNSRRIGLSLKHELVGRFNERICTPSAYLEIPSYQGIIELTRVSYDTDPLLSKVGHAVLICCELPTSNDQVPAYEYVPFALDPETAKRVQPSNWHLGLHRHVVREAQATFPDLTGGYSLALMTNDYTTVYAKMGYPHEIPEEDISLIRDLSLATPIVQYLLKGFEDDASIRVTNGKIESRQLGPTSQWIEEE